MKLHFLSPLIVQGWLVDGTINPSTGVVAQPADMHSAMIWTREARFRQLGREAL